MHRRRGEAITHFSAHFFSSFLFGTRRGFSQIPLIEQIVTSCVCEAIKPDRSA
jgi:hypothetical protein